MLGQPLSTINNWKTIWTLYMRCWFLMFYSITLVVYFSYSKVLMINYVQSSHGSNTLGITVLFMIAD